MSQPDPAPILPLSLGQGLCMRRATPEDAEPLADFNIRIHSDDPINPEIALGHWIRDLMRGGHPTTMAGDFTVVVDESRGGAIVSSLSLISQTWAYDGIAVGVGHPELVGTDPQYRRRGLVRAQFEAIHAHRGISWKSSCLRMPGMCASPICRRFCNASRPCWKLV